MKNQTNNINNDEFSEFDSKLKDKMENIKIPDELAGRVRAGVEKAALERAAEKKTSKSPFKRIGKSFLQLSHLEKAGVFGGIAAVLVIAILMYTYIPIYITIFNNINNPVIAGATDTIPKDYVLPAEEEPIAEPDTGIIVTEPGKYIDEGIALSSVGKVTITPLSQTDNGVTVNSQFEVKTTEPFSEQELLERLSVKTGELFTVNFAGTEGQTTPLNNIKQSNIEVDQLSKINQISETESKSTEFILSFDKPLETNKIYNIEYREDGNRPLSFAFQTEENFKLLSIFPVDEGDNWRYNVPIDTIIELTFSEELPNNIDLSDYVTIIQDYYREDGSISGRWEKSEQSAFKYIFFPATLNNERAYYINVKSGITSKSGEVMTGEYKSKFSTVKKDESKGYLDVYGNAFESFLTDDEVFVELAVPPKMCELTYKAEIYEINSNKDFADLLNAASQKYGPDYGSGYWYWEESYNLNYDKDKPPLPDDSRLIGTMETLLVNVNREYTWNMHNYLILKRTLPEGYYMIVISTEDEGIEYKTIKLIQVTNLAVYVDSVGEDIVVWVNDARAENINESAVKDAKITYGKSEVSTDKDGIAVFKPDRQSAKDDKLFAVEYSGLKPFYTLIRSHEASKVPLRDKYYHYIYTDRRIYRPNDTIDVFGCIRPRMGYEPISDKDEIMVSLGNIYNIPVKLDAYGCFTIEIPISDYNGWGHVVLKVNGEEFQYAYLEFLDYDNSMYNFDISTDRQVYAMGEEIQMTAAVTLFDGAPAPDVEFTISFQNEMITKKTDLSGMLYASLRYIDEFAGSPRDWRPFDTNIQIETSGIENHKQYAYHNVTIVTRDVMAETSSSGNTVEITLSEIDMEKYNDYTRSSAGYRYYLYERGNRDNIRAKPHDSEITVQIRKQYLTKENIRYEYDAIEKKNVERYDVKYNYDWETRVYSTAGGKLTITDLPVGVWSADQFKNVSYMLEISFKDAQGRTAADSIYYDSGGYNYYNMTSTIRQFIFHNEDKTELESHYGYYYSGSNISTRVNESIRLNPYAVTVGQDPEKITKGKSLGIVTQDKLLKTLTPENSAGITFTMNEEWLPNISVGGAYFDGRRIYSVMPKDILYDYSERTLDISAEFDKKIYKPGDEVTVKISVTDENGKGKKSNLNLNAVDEAAIQTGWYDESDFPNSFYTMKYFELNRSVYVSYTQHEFGNLYDGAMGGGGGDDGIRKDFRDNPAFTTVETDENGVAEIKFTIADSLTTWRITMHAVTKDDHVGKTKEFITAQLPFYTDIVMTNEFIEGDDISAYARCFGTDYSPFDQKDVEYAIEIKQDGNIINSESVTAGGTRHFNLGKLPAGEYIIKITAKFGGYFDGMELPFKVIKSGVRLNLSAYEELNEDKQTLSEYDITAGPVRISMWNADMQVIYKILSDSASSSTSRTDRYAANIYAGYYMDNLLEVENAKSEQSYIGEFTSYLNRNGIYQDKGIPEIIYGDPDIGYSARFAACYPEFFRDNINIEHYFAKNVYEIKDYRNGFTTKIEPDENFAADVWGTRSVSYLGLAALGKPVLSDIYKDLAILTDEIQYMEYTVMLYYAAALCVLGDDTGAWNLINDLIPYDEIDSGKMPSNRELVETIMLFINTTIDPKAALEYVKSYEKNEYVSNSLELIYFVKNYIPAGEGVRSSVSYTLDGKTEQKELTNYDFAWFALSREMFDAFHLTNTKGGTSVHIDYIGSAENLEEENKKIGITRTIYGTLKVGNTVEICYEVTLPKNTSDNQIWLTINDRLPNGMRYQSKNPIDEKAKSNATVNSKFYTAGNREKQFVDIHFGTNSTTSVKVSYYAIVIGAGEYIFEPAYINIGYGNFNIENIWGATERTTVKISN